MSSDVIDKIYKSKLYCAYHDPETIETVYLWFKPDDETELKYEAKLSKEYYCSLDFFKKVIRRENFDVLFRITVIRDKDAPEFLLPNEYWDDAIKKGRNTETVFDMNTLRFTPWLRFFNSGLYAGTTFKDFNDFYIGLAMLSLINIVALTKEDEMHIITTLRGLDEV